MKMRLMPGIKLKDAPLEFRVALRLTTLSEQLQTEADLAVIAQELGVTLPQVVAAVQVLTTDKHVEVTGIHMPKISFKMPESVLAKLRTYAHSYRNHLEVQQVRAEHRAANGGTQKPALPPIEDKAREACLKDAKPLAARLSKLERDHDEWRIAGCIARIGKERVAALVDKTCKGLIDRKQGAYGAFFDLYCAERDKEP